MPSLDSGHTRGDVRRSVSILALLAAGWPGAADAGPLEKVIDAVEGQLRAARAYHAEVGDDVTPVALRRRFLALDDAGCPTGDRPPASILAETIDALATLSWEATAADDRERIERLMDEAVPLALHGWVLAGSLESMEAQPPHSIRGPSRPLTDGCRPDVIGGHEPQHAGHEDHVGPVAGPALAGAPNAELDPAAGGRTVRAARDYYQRGLDVFFASLKRRRPADSALVTRVDDRPIPSTPGGPPGSSDHRHAGLTYYRHEGAAIPIPTAGHLTGILLRHRGQIVTTDVKRLWSEAFLGPRSGPGSDRQRRLLAAATEARVGARDQFWGSVALGAGTAAADLGGGAGARYQVYRFHETLQRLIAGDRPTLPIGAITATDRQVNALIATIEGDGPGSLRQASRSYGAARDARNEVDRAALVDFDIENRRQALLVELEQLTGVEPATELGTPRDRDAYFDRVEDRIEQHTGSAVIELRKPEDGTTSNALDDALGDWRRTERSVDHTRQRRDQYDERIAIERHRRDEVIEANIEAGRHVQRFQRRIGQATDKVVSTTASIGGGFSLGPVSFGGGGSRTVTRTGSAEAGIYQARITGRVNTERRRTETAGSAAVVGNLQLDQAALDAELAIRREESVRAASRIARIVDDAQRLLWQIGRYDHVDGLWFMDPLLEQALPTTEDQSNSDLRALDINLYELTLLLQRRWLELFMNPVDADDGEAVPLGEGFSLISGIESLIALPHVDIGNRQRDPVQFRNTYYEALIRWDSILRQGRAYRSDPLPVTISLRQDVLGHADVKTDARGTVYLDAGHEADRAIRERNRRRFQHDLLDHLLVRDDGSRRGVLVAFPLHHDQAMFTEGRLGIRPFEEEDGWNYRIGAVRLKLMPIPGERLSSERFRVHLGQAGVAHNVSFAERIRQPRRFELYDIGDRVRYDLQDLGRSGHSPRLVVTNAMQDDFLHDDQIPEATGPNMAAENWTPFASEWLLQIESQSNDFEIEALDDIVIQLDLVQGQPACPDLWPHCR